MQKKDLTTGSITKNLLSLSLPTMFGYLSYTLYDLADMAWIGRISPEALASVTIVATIFWLVEVLNEVIGTSSVSLISQSFGAGNLDRTRRVIEQTLTFKALVALIAAGILLISLKPLVMFFTQDPQVQNYCFEYGTIRLYFLPLMFSSYTVNTALRCTGDAKKPMIIMFASSLLNILLDPVFIFDLIPGTTIPGLGLGIFGAALATVLSGTLAFAAGLFILFSNYSRVRISFNGLYKLDWSIDKKLLTIGLPAGLEMFFRNFAQFFTLKLISFYGTIALAALGIGRRLIGFAFMPLLGLLIGGSAIAGQNLGAGNIERAEKTAYTASILGGIIITLILLVMMFIPEMIMAVFTNSGEVINTGIPMIRLVSIGLLATGFMFGLASVFSGSGYNIPFLISSIVSRWLFQLPFLYLAIVIFKTPLFYVWVSFPLADLIELVLIVLYFKRGKWRSVRV